MNKKARSKISLKPKAPFKLVLMDIVPSTAPKRLTSDTIFLTTFSLFIHTPIFQNFMVWRKSQQKKLWTNWICFNPDLGKLTNFYGGI